MPRQKSFHEINEFRGDTRTVLYTAAEHERAEEELKRHRDELQLLVEERTEMLREAYDDLEGAIKGCGRTAEQLRQAQKMEAIGTLAGGIAHEFNNMLAVIMGNAELALDDLVEEGRRWHLNQILKASERSGDLVKQLLTEASPRSPKEHILVVDDEPAVAEVDQDDA